MLWHTNSKLSNQGFKILKKKENWGMQRKWRDRDWRPWERPPWKQHMSSIPGLNRTRRFSVCLTVKKIVTNVEGTEEECWRDWRNQPLKLTLGLNSTRSTSVPKLINKQKKKSENARGNSLFEALSQGSWEKRVARGGIGGVLGKLSFLCLTTEVFHVPDFFFSQLTGSLAQISSNTAMWPTYWVTKAWICFWLTAEDDEQQSILWCLWPLLTCTFTNYLF